MGMLRLSHVEIRVPDLELAVDRPLHHRASNFIVGPEEMPVRFTPTARRDA